MKLRTTQKTMLAYLLALFLGATMTTSSANEEPETVPSYTNLTTAELLAKLPTADFADKEAIIKSINDKDEPTTLVVLKALAAGQLYWSSAQSKAFIQSEKNEDEFLDALSNEPAPDVRAETVEKITINNKLRSQMRRLLAAKSIRHPDASVRLAAIKENAENLNDDMVVLLEKQLPLETDKNVAHAIEQAIAVYHLQSDDVEAKVKAINILAASDSEHVLNQLREISKKDENGLFVETNAPVRQAAAEAVSEIENRLSVYTGVQTLYYGLSLGSVLLLSAIGLAITFGVMGVINMAHGELMMIGAYTTFVVQQLMPNYIDYSLWVAIPAAFLIAGLVGIAIERGVIRFLYGRPLETLLATFGISLILQQLVRTVFSPLNRSVETPSWMSGAWEINNALALTYNRLYIIIFSLLVFAALVFILRKTALGLHVRAVSQNRQMAAAVGIRTTRVDVLTFGLGSGIAGVAGVALSQLTNVGPNLGQSYIVDSFMVVVFGGVGNLWGTLIGSMSLGVVNKLIEPWSGAVMAKIIVLIFIILFIQKRPRGLFPQKGRVQEA